jgi:hypothetical protein
MYDKFILQKRSIIVKDYSDPVIWSAYLREHSLSSEIPAPSRKYIEAWGELTEKQLERLVADWVWRNDRRAREAEMVHDFNTMQRLIEATT